MPSTGPSAFLGRIRCKTIIEILKLLAVTSSAEERPCLIFPAHDIIAGWKVFCLKKVRKQTSEFLQWS